VKIIALFLSAATLATAQLAEIGRDGKVTTKPYPPPASAVIDRATAQPELYAAEWELIHGLYQFAGPSMAGVDPTGSALENMRKIKSYGDNLPADSPLKQWAMAQGAYLQGLWVWCERERTKLGVTVGYGERYISQ
jgi:hypothetical protein